MFLFGRFTEGAQQIPLNAQKEAARLNHDYIGAEHMLLGLLKDDSTLAAQVLHQRGIELDMARAEVEKLLGKKDKRESIHKISYTENVKNVIGFAIEEGFNMGHHYVGPEHLLLGLLRDQESLVGQVLKNLGADLEKVQQDLIHQVVASHAHGQDSDCTSCGDCSKKAQTPTLDDFAYDLTRLAREGKLDPVVGREAELERVIQVLSRRTKNNPCLVGEAGVGKTAIVEGLAQRIVERNVPDILLDKQIFTLEISSLIAGTKYRGEFEERMHKLLQEVLENQNVILFIDEVHTIIGAGASQGAMDTANVLKPALAKGDLQVIGATTLNEFRKYIERDPALERRFQPVMVGEPTAGESLEILKRLRDCYEAHHDVSITDEALEAAVKLGSRYIQDRYLPDKAIDLMDEAASRVRILQKREPQELREIEELKEKITGVRQEKDAAVKSQDYEKAARLRDEEQKLEKDLASLENTLEPTSVGCSRGEPGQGEDHLARECVTEETIAHVVSSWTGIPVKKLTEEESTRLLHLEDTLHQRVIGQQEAVTAVSRAIRRGRVGLKDPARPTGSFMFLGPTGVGKTELARTLAETLFGDEDAMIRLDMSEYMDKHTTSRLIGAPPGYVGYEEGGQLAEKVRRKPYSVILLDEIEKAHPDVFNVLLQILEDGRLTDGKGRTVDFRNTVIIMTSNVGAGFIRNQPTLGFKTVDVDRTYEDMKGRLLEELRRTFRPEFLNRLDDIVVFNALTEAGLGQIVELMLGELSGRFAELGFQLDVSEEAKAALVEEGYDLEYGARPLRRVIQRRLEDTLSEQILQGGCQKGDTIQVYLEEVDGKKSFGFRNQTQTCGELLSAVEQSE